MIYDITFTHGVFLHGKQMTAYEQIRLHAVVADCFTWF